MDRRIYENISRGKFISISDMEAYQRQCNQNLEMLSIRRSCTNAILSPADYRDIEESVRQQGELIKVLNALKHMDTKRTSQLKDILKFVIKALESMNDSGSLRNAANKILNLISTTYYIEDAYMNSFDINYKILAEESDKYKQSITDKSSMDRTPDEDPTQMTTFIINAVNKMLNDVTIYRVDIKSTYLKTMSDLDINSIYESEQIWPNQSNLQVNQPEGTLESQFLLQVKAYFKTINIDSPVEELQKQLEVIDKFEKILFHLKEYEHSDDVDRLLGVIHDKLSIISMNILIRIENKITGVE